ncbi:MAG: glycosyltransferase family 87 protein [Pseudomonadota bacterium]
MTSRDAASRLSPRDALLAALIAVSFVALLLAQSWGRIGTDISALYLGGWLAAAGQAELLYAATPSFLGEPVAPGWVAASEAAGFERAVVAYVYPPIWAALVAPLTAVLGPAGFANLFSAAGLSAYALSGVAVWRLCRPSMGLPAFLGVAFGLSLFSLAFLFAWALVQPQLIVIALILWSAERLARGRQRAAGLLLGLAAAIKVMPILLIVLFVAERQWRAALWAVGTSGLIAAISVFVVGWPAHAAFLEAGALLNGATLLYGGNLTFGVLAHALFYPGAIESFPPNNTFVPTRLWLDLLAKVVMAGAAMATLLGTRHLGAQRIPARLLLLLVSFTFFAPLAWSHYYAPVLLLTLGFWGTLPARMVALTVSAALAMMFAPLGNWLAQLPGDLPVMQIYMALMLALCMTTFWLGLRGRIGA